MAGVGGTGAAFGVCFFFDVACWLGMTSAPLLPQATSVVAIISSRRMEGIRRLMGIPQHQDLMHSITSPYPRER